MGRSKRSIQPIGQASLYTRRRPLLFMALAPAVLSALAILAPFSVVGLLLIIPGLSGIAGLIGLTLAWIGLIAPGLVARRGGTILFLFVASLPAIALGVSALLITTEATPSHATDPMKALGPASAAFTVLAAFFIAGVIAWDSAPIKASDVYGRRWKIVGIVVACITMPLPMGGILAAVGYGRIIRHDQASQAEVLSQRATVAVDAYRAAHDGAVPLDNTTAGLPSPAEMNDTYVESVTLANDEVTLHYRDNAVARFFGAGGADVSLVFRPDVDHGARWTCLMDGCRHIFDSPLPLIDDSRRLV